MFNIHAGASIILTILDAAVSMIINFTQSL